MAVEFPSGGEPFTAADLERMPDDGRRYEIIDGMLCVSAAPFLEHQRAVGCLYRVLYEARPADIEVVVAPFAVVAVKDCVMQPDIVVARRSDFTRRDLPVAPLLVVEVLSPSTRLHDTHVKRVRFEGAGTQSFWVVDPTEEPEDTRLVVWELGADGRYGQVADVKGDDAYRAVRPYPVTVVPADLVR